MSFLRFLMKATVEITRADLALHAANQFESDEYHSAVAKSVTEAQKLVEAGFEHVCNHENLMLFRKRK